MGNEIADFYAKKAITEGLLVNLLPTKTAFKRKALTSSLSHWEMLWDRSKDGRATHVFFPKPNLKLFQCDFYVNQMLTSHGYFPAYFKRFKLRSTISCNCLSTDEANNQHYLTSCRSTCHLYYQLSLIGTSDAYCFQIYREMSKRHILIGSNCLLDQMSVYVRTKCRLNVLSLDF